MATESATSYRLEKAAALLGVSTRTLGRWNSAGKLEVVRLPDVPGVRVPVAEVERIRRERVEEMRKRAEESRAEEQELAAVR